MNNERLNSISGLSVIWFRHFFYSLCFMTFFILTTWKIINIDFSHYIPINMTGYVTRVVVGRIYNRFCDNDNTDVRNESMMVLVLLLFNLFKWIFFLNRCCKTTLLYETNAISEFHGDLQYSTSLISFNVNLLINVGLKFCHLSLVSITFFFSRFWYQFMYFTGNGIFLFTKMYYKFIVQFNARKFSGVVLYQK